MWPLVSHFLMLKRPFYYGGLWRSVKPPMTLSFFIVTAYFGQITVQKSLCWQSCALPLVCPCSRVIWPNEAFIQPSQLYYVWNKTLSLSLSYGVAVETDEHLTAVERRCHDNAANPHPCICVLMYVCVRVLFFVFCFFCCIAVWVGCDMLSSARDYGSRELEQSWCLRSPPLV